MATKNALFYSSKFNRPDTIKSHRTKRSAMKSVKDFGMIYETATGKEHQVHMMSNGMLAAFEEEGQGHEPMNFKIKDVLQELGLI